jgi:hypothetical protein
MQGVFDDWYNLSRFRRRQRKSAELKKQDTDPDSSCNKRPRMMQTLVNTSYP